MNYQANLQRAIDLANKAVEAETAALAKEKEKPGSSNMEEVRQMYLTALDHWMLVIKHESNPNLKAKLNEKVVGYMDRAEKIKKFIQDQNKKDDDDENKDNLQKDGAGTGVARRPSQSG